MQLVYKQPALKWQIAKQLSGLNPLSLTNNKNYLQIKEKGWGLLCNKHKIAAKQTITQNLAVSSKVLL